MKDENLKIIRLQVDDDPCIEGDCCLGAMGFTLGLKYHHTPLKNNALQ